MKCNQSRWGFELVSPCPFPPTITITPRALPTTRALPTPCFFVVFFLSLTSFSLLFNLSLSLSLFLSLSLSLSFSLSLSLSFSFQIFFSFSLSFRYLLLTNIQTIKTPVLSISLNLRSYKSSQYVKGWPLRTASSISSLRPTFASDNVKLINIIYAFIEVQI